MANPPYIVIRLVPQSPVDGGTFGADLNGLELQVLDANTLAPLSDFAYSSPLVMFQWFPLGNIYLGVVSEPTSQSTPFKGKNNYGTTLTLHSTDGISVGSSVFSSSDQTASQPLIPTSAGLTVASVTAATSSTTPGTVVLSGTLQNYVPAGTVVSFIEQNPGGDPGSPPSFSFPLSTNSPATTIDGKPPTSSDPLRVLHFADTSGVRVGMSVTGTSVASGTTVAELTSTTVTVSQALSGSPASVTFKLNPPFAWISIKPSSGTPAAKPTTLKFTSPTTANGVAAGMTLLPIPGLVAPGTTVTGATASAVTISPALLGALPSGQAITFTFPLSSGIVQHVEIIGTSGFFGLGYVIVPAAVATAVIPLNLTTPPVYLDIKINARRGLDVIPIDNTFYNVLVSTDTLPSTPDQYQGISPSNTSLYIALPPVPGGALIPLAIPSDGSAPPYDALFQAVQTALKNDPILGVSGIQDLITSPEYCKRIAYDIVWSYQNTLPAPPDLLESLYTNPPNPGASSSTDSSGTNNLETDRQRFEGSLNSFYSTRNATAERLAKFVAAVSAAVFCEQTSLNSTAALLEFPVDPSSSFVGAVESELLVNGLGVSGTSKIVFGVPAAFFYALSANVDKSTSAAQRFQFATGDAIDRLLQQFTTAVNAGAIKDSEPFADTSHSLPDVTSFQAARRLVALGISAASNSSFVTVQSGSPLASLIGDWLAAVAPAATNPPLTYQQIDFNIWTKTLDVSDPQGYLALDLDALTEGYIIPSFTATPATASGLTLTFTGIGLGIGPGMPVSGSSVAAGTVVKTVKIDTTTTPPTTTVTLSAAASSTATLTFNATGSSVLPSTLADQIAAWLPSTTTLPPPPTVATLKQVNATQWTNLFTDIGNPQWLPPFTQPVPGTSTSTAPPKTGYVALRIRAFIRAVQKFFTVSSVNTTAQLPAPGAPPVFDLPVYDPIKKAAGDLGLTFGDAASTGILSTGLPAEVRTVFPSDVAAQDWLTQAMSTINDLDEVASVVPNPTITGYTLPNKVSFNFSVMEALYARGFRSAKDITNLSATDFQQAMTGTVAYDFANSTTNSLYDQAQKIAPHSPASGSTGESFQPINPDGSLVNCVPPPCLSPLGPIAYLQEMLTLSQESTCEDPSAPPASEQTTLGEAVKARRGPLGALLASCANLETPLPSIDIVNECLEYLATAPAAPSGTVYDTSADRLVGHELCQERDCSKEKDRDCHDPEVIFAALPEYSTPATPVKGKNDSVEPLAFNNLKVDFSTCHLPYSQALDVSRTYLSHFGSCRFEELRTFRKCITEFALQPEKPPTGFQSYLWRYPVRLEIAIEYLGITPEEYTLLFQGTPLRQCGPSEGDSAPRPTTGSPPAAPPPGATATGAPAPGVSATSVPVSVAPATGSPAATVPVSVAPASGVSASTLYGFSSSGGDLSWMNEVAVLSEFLSRTCLTYCEFLELSKTVLPQFTGGTDSRTQEISFPDCEPCCLKDYRLPLPQGDAGQQALLQLALFIRLWRKLKHACGAGYTFEQLYDICTVLKWFSGTAINPEFIRQLASFQILRDQFKLPLVDRSDKAKASGTTGADRTHLLALWIGSGAKKWNWAVGEFIEGVESHARMRYGCERPRGDALERMAANLDALSRLAGFNPPTATNPSNDTWNSDPGCTLRFAEVLAKIAASNFRIGELLYLFNATPPQDCEDPFPLQDDPDDALHHPFDLPEEPEDYALWRLRKELLEVELPEEEVCEWTWSRLVFEFRTKFGYAPPSGQDPLLSIGQHFFPCVLEESGYSVSGKQRQYRTPLTSTTAWNSPLGSPFQYDAGSGELWVQLPLGDEAVAAKLSQLPALNPAEQAAVQDLYFAPRADLAFLAFLFPDWQSAEIHLIQEREESERWSYFRRHFARADARRKVIARHLAKHVAHRSGCRAEDLESVAALVLSRLFADENTGTPWESDSGVLPTVMWTPPPAGGAIPALLGLIGTGLLGDYQAQPAATGGTSPAPSAGGSSDPIVWREVRGPLEAFGHERDHTNAPVPTVLPAIGLSLSSNPLVTIHNGYAVKNANGLRLGGAEAFRVRWSGVLLVEDEGEYAFHAGAPTSEGERPDFERAEKSHWRVTLKRGLKTWEVLNHQWPGDTNPERSEPRLRRGAYQIVVEYSQPAPDFTSSHLHQQRTGFQLKYAGPDSDGCLVALPLKRLYRDFKDSTLDQGITFLPGSKNAQAFLKAFYTSTIRDIRRTYQRAFKAVLFAGKLGLSARHDDDGQSELGYMLSNPGSPVGFAGYAYYRTSSTAFTQHLAYFDFNFLPLQDNYHAPTPVPPDRSTPSLQRTQAMFDWWERIFDYGLVRKEVFRSCEGPLWRLFLEAKVNPPTDPAQLLGHIGAKPGYWHIDLRFCQDQNTAIYQVTSTDLEDDRWLVRVWHADRWVRRLLNRFHPKSMSKARPDLWSAPDPSAPMPASGVSETGNANLSAFLADGCLENGEPRRYEDLRRLNDGLRERGRNALVSYLCALNRVALPWTPTPAFATGPGDLSDLLLLDVETGICEKASRIQEAITAVQTFVRRSRLGLEPDWKPTRHFARLWDSRFDTYRTWERCKRRELYRESWIEWFELGKARRIEAFRFLESQLRTSTLTLAAPGGLDWWADDDEALEHKPKLLQRRIPSELHPLSPPREGLGVLGTPEYAAQPTWLAPVPQVSATNSAPAPASGPAGPAPSHSSSTLPTSAPTAARGPSSPAGSAAPPPTTALSLARAVASGSTQPQGLPLWMESAMKLGTQFVRVAAAGVPQAALRFAPHGDEPRDTCCQECGCDHPVLVDEYYFWLVNAQFYSYTDETDAQQNPNISFTGSYQFGFQDSYYDQFQQQSAEWNEEDRVPSLLAKWQPNPAVRLAWCRVHNGQFGQPRKSREYVAIAQLPDLVFLGRAGDSLYFQVTGSAPLPAGYGGTGGDTSPPGFRYDLPVDDAVALPQVLKPPAPVSPNPYPGGLLSYPFFAYHDPGARLFPASWFSVSITVAEALRTRCCFEPALKWYQRAFDPLKRDNTWMNCDRDASRGTGSFGGTVVGVAAGPPSLPAPPAPPSTTGVTSGTVVGVAAGPSSPPAPPPPGRTGPANVQSACCDSSKVTDEGARNRALTLHYCQTLMDWGDALMRRRHSPEAFQQARLIYGTVAKIMGRCPQTILLNDPVAPLTVSAFTPAYPSLNPRLLDLYSLVEDRLGLIHRCLDARRFRNGQPGRDMYYFGDSPWRDGWRTVSEPCADDEEWCCRPSPYHFLFQVQKAIELAARVRELGAELLSAYEKGDAEYLSSLRAGQEQELLALGLTIRQDQWRDADWQVQALQQNKDVNQTNLLYYTNLYQNGLINNEIQNLSLATNAMQTRTSANVVGAFAESFKIVPDFFVGAMSTFTQIPIGTKLAGLFETIAKVMQTVADIQSATASIDLTQAGWQRRSDEWVHQILVLPIEIQQIELQILGAQRRRDQALQELNNQQRQIENATEVQDFLRDKFTATDLYLWLQKETAAMHCKMYELAHRAAREAQRAYNFERGHTTRRFIPEETWDNLHEGLMAGERLEFALRHMEKAFLDENVREYELTKHFSLRLQFPMEFLRLKLTGRCIVELPEWMFDLDYPGQYMRRIKNVTLTIPCVTGPYTGVHCRATLLSSITRIDPRLEPPATRCCCECGSDDDTYETCPHDLRVVRSYAAREAIATSSGQNDPGVFDLRGDERYAPFEFQGAVSRWRIELPAENNYIDIKETLTDVVMQLNYTSREGGDMLRRAASKASKRHLPGSGWCLFDVRHEFPDAWQLLRDSCREKERGGRLDLRIHRKMFPFVPGADDLSVPRMAILFSARDRDDCDRPRMGECPCPRDQEPARRVVEFIRDHRDRDHDSLRVSCLRSDEWPDLYYGFFETHAGPLGRHDQHEQVGFRFPKDIGEVERIYLLCQYQLGPCADTGLRQRDQ
jgi:hypothetical protein